MNVNEVLSNRAIQLLGGKIGSKSPVHPNDDVNMGQSSNDSFPTAMHIAAVLELEDHLLPHAEALSRLDRGQGEGMERTSSRPGATHLQDAVPLTVGQEWSGYARQIRDALERIRVSEEGLYELAAGGTAVGTGLNAPAGFSQEIASKIAELTGHPFVTAPNKFAAQGSLDGMVAAMRSAAWARGCVDESCKRYALARVRAALRLGRTRATGATSPAPQSCRERLTRPSAEAMVMVCIQVIGEDNAVAFAGSQGNFELNAMRPVIINNFIHSARILGDACDKFRRFSVEGTRLNRKRIDEAVGRSLMLVTALSPVIGYDKASAIAHKANDDDLTLREAALQSGYIDAKRFDEIVDPKKMTGHGLAGA